MDITKIDSQMRFCTWENYGGLRRHYICGHPKTCCALGCCVSAPFSFYQLWYFWLLLLLIILVCSGGGWWFRWRHGGFSNHSTPTSNHIRARRHRAARTQGHSGVRVYPHPHSYYTGQGAPPDDYTLPPGYDKDPPSYNEVISHLSQFPRAGAESGGTEDAGGDGILPSAPPVTASILNCQTSVPPPSYEMVLDLKKREMQLQREINVEEQLESVNSTRSKIRNILGRVRPYTTTPESQPPALEAYVPTNFSSSNTTPSGLFTISRESLPSQEFYNRASSSSSHPQSLGIARNTSSPSSVGSSSHSDYSSSFISSPSSAGRSLVTPPSPLPPPEYFPPSTPRSIDVLNPEPQDPATHTEEPPTLDHAGTSRPCTGRSVLSRPTTSISARTLPPPPQLVRKTSLPGAVLENDEDKGDK